MDNISRIRERAGCTSRCSLSSEYRSLAKSDRVRHNGVRFSHAVDVDDLCLAMLLPDVVTELLSLWCQEHHAGRDGHEIQMSCDGVTQTVPIPEAVGP